MLAISKINLQADQKKKMATICISMISQWTRLFPWHVYITLLIFLIHLRSQMISLHSDSVSQNSIYYLINKNNYWSQSLGISIKIKMKMDIMHSFNYRLMTTYSIHFLLSSHLWRKLSVLENSWKATLKLPHFWMCWQLLPWGQYYPSLLIITEKIKKLICYFHHPTIYFWMGSQVQRWLESTSTKTETGRYNWISSF